MNSQTFEIKSKSYSLNVDVFSNEMIKTEHKHAYKQNKQVDIYASNWCLAFSDIEEGACKIRSGDEWLKLSGPIAIFVPPFSIIEWEVEKKRKFKWTCIMSTCEIPFKTNSQPVLLQYNIKCPNTSMDVFKTINFLTKNGVSLSEKRQASAIAIRAKNYLDNHFREKVMISDVAKNLKVSRVVLSRSFTSHFGISLTDYRHRLRLFEALSLTNKGVSITDAIISVGFSDSSQFNLHFKNYFSTQPKEFAVNKRTKSKN